jgi:hypothetical protein
MHERNRDRKRSETEQLEDEEPMSYGSMYGVRGRKQLACQAGNASLLPSFHTRIVMNEPSK